VTAVLAVVAVVLALESRAAADGGGRVGFRDVMARCGSRRC
jgi:hypothetical protein